MKAKSKKWIKPRHKFIQRLAKIFLYYSTKIKYGAKITKCRDKRQRLILANHQTPFDQFFIAYGFNAPIYYLASEDIFSNGFISKLLRYAVNPIPIKKQTSDVKAVMNCMRVAKEGGSIAIFPEGNRTYSGTTEYISIAIVKLVKAIKLPLTFFKIEGGYGVMPRWADKIRKGKITAGAVKTLEPEEYLKLSDDELYHLIKQELYVDERKMEDTYKSNRRAEYLERTLYVCPHCKIAKFYSDKNIVKCTSCNREIEYGQDKILKGCGFDFEFKYLKEWCDYQNDFISKLNLQDYIEKPLFSDEVTLFNVELYKKKTKAKAIAKLTCYGDRIEIDEKVFNFKDIIALSVLGKNKLNMYHVDKVYQIKGDKRFNALKYVNIYYASKNADKEGENGKFLGL